MSMAIKACNGYLSSLNMSDTSSADCSVSAYGPVIRTTDDKTITGKIVNDANGKYTVVLDPEDSSKVVELKKEDVADVKPSNISLMPEKLLNGLNENEVLDLLAYMLSRGDPNHAMFKK